MLPWKPRIISLLARHGTDKYKDALPHLCRIIQQRIPEVHHDVLVIDNALPPDHEEKLEEGIALVGGSNAAWEFSAWDSGIEYMRGRLDGYDFVLLVTSAFRQLYTRYLDRLNLGMLSLLRGRAAAAGHVDYYDAPVSLLRTGSQAWLRSSFILVPPVELQLLRSVVSVMDHSLFFSGDHASPFPEAAPVSDGYRNSVLGWLTAEGTGQGTTWHSRFDLSTETLPFFEKKTLAIFNEQMLSNRLVAQGCALVDMTWLATQAGSQEGKTLGAIPNWRWQVTSRDEAAAPASLL